MEGNSLRSIRSSSRVHTRGERGFAIIAAFALAVLYFGLMELILIDASRALSEAQRFRSRVLAAALAEDAAELAAVNMRYRTGGTNTLERPDRQLTGKLVRNGENFEIVGEGKSIGAMTQEASVRVQGRMGEDGVVKIDYTMHGQ
jgi:hypothetical protein